MTRQSEKVKQEPAPVIKRVVGYHIMLGREKYKTVQVLETHYVTGIIVASEAAQLALEYPDVRVSVEIVVG